MSTAIETHPQPYLRIRPTSGWAALNLSEVWQFRDLLMTLAGRDLKLRYRQTLLGVAWVLLQPLFAAGIFTIVFGVVAKLPSNGLPYFVFSYAGMLAWGVFNNTLSKSSISLVGNAQLVSKVYFPRIVLPLSSVLSSLIDFAVAMVVMVVLMIAYRIAPGPQLILLPVWVAMVIVLGLAIGLFASSLTVSYRDVQYLLPVVLQLLLYASPVGYAVPESPDWVRTLFLLNPMTGLLEGFRWSLLGGSVHWSAVVYSIAFAIIAFVVGAFAFKRMERRFADVI
jgi:lipopolysaccharide transport system permease protein